MLSQYETNSGQIINVLQVKEYNNRVASRNFDKAWDKSKPGYRPSAAFFYWCTQKGNFRTKGYVAWYHPYNDERTRQYFAYTKREAIAKAQKI